MRSIAVRLFKVVFWSSFFLVVVGCGNDRQTNVENEPAALSVFKPSYAKGFEAVLLADSSLKIVLFNLEAAGETLQVIRWRPRDVQRIACLSTTHVSFLDALDKLPVLKGVGFADRLFAPNLKDRVNSGELINLTAGNELDAEAVFSIQPELLFVYPFGGKSYEKFLQKGIGCVQVSEYLERHPLGRAEWIKLFGYFTGRQAQADSIFSSIEQEYLILRDSVANSEGYRPSVFAGSMDGDRWAVPSSNSYLAQLVNDAGGRWIFSDTSSTGNLVVSFEDFYSTASGADYWGKLIYESAAPTVDMITQGDARLMELKAFQAHRVFACNTMLTDYHGRALLEPAALLRDLQKIFTNVPANESYRYFVPWLIYN